MFSGLRRLAEEDITLSLEKNVQTNEMLLKGLGDVHLEVAVEKLKSKFNAEAELRTPVVPYRETIRKSVKAQGKYKKQSGGHGQYGDCWIEFNPSDKDFEFVDKVVGGLFRDRIFPRLKRVCLNACKEAFWPDTL